MKNKLKLAEAMGIILGDGNLHKTENRITITGSLEDQFYYKFRVIPLFKSLFGKPPKLVFIKNKKACNLVLENKNIFQFLIKEVGLKRGNKTKAVIPSFILKQPELKNNFLRGILDTDGCIKFSKQTKNFNYYPRIRITLKESKVSEKIESILTSLGFNFSKWTDNRSQIPVKYFEISGIKMVNKWINGIGFGNMVHASKYLFWKKFGFHMPKSSLEERIKKLDLSLSTYLTINCPNYN